MNELKTTGRARTRRFKRTFESPTSHLVSLKQFALAFPEGKAWLERKKMARKKRKR